MDNLSNFKFVSIQSEWIRAGAILAAFLAVALLASMLWQKVIDARIRQTRSPVDDMISSALRGLIIWGLILSGAHYAFLELSVTQSETVIWTLLGKGFIIAWIFLLVTTAMRFMNTFAQWRIGQVAASTTEAPRDITTRITFLRKLANATIVLFGGLYILSVAGIDISPIIAGGALSGIVIGIALQDTLSNIFAGFFLNFDRPIRIGDFIRIDNNQEGYVEDVGWRYSRVRLIANNLLIIPNNKLSQSLITNYSLQGYALSVSVPCTVGYDNDLEQVEQLALTVARKIQDAPENQDSVWEPQVRFKEFGPDSISLVVVLRSKHDRVQNQLQHKFIKALQAAFRENEIKFPK